MNQRLILLYLWTEKRCVELLAYAKQIRGNLTIMNKNLIRPTDAEDALINAAAMSDADAMPLTDKEWEQVKPQLHRGPGRPLGSGTKAQVTLRLDLEVIEILKATGLGWQTRANEVLRNWAHSKH